jgi:hypothetical protein
VEVKVPFICISGLRRGRYLRPLFWDFSIGCLILSDGTDRLSRNVGNHYQPTRRNIPGERRRHFETLRDTNPVTRRHKPADLNPQRKTSNLTVAYVVRLTMLLVTQAVRCQMASLRELLKHSTGACL